MLSAAGVTGKPGRLDAVGGRAAGPAPPGCSAGCPKASPHAITKHVTTSLTWPIFRSHGLEHDHGNQHRSRWLPRGS